MAELVPFRVRLLRGRIDGKGKPTVWPDFSQIASGNRGDIDWAMFVDSLGIRWQYDKVSNLGKGAEEEFAYTLLPQSFADDAVSLFPTECAIVTELIFRDFWDRQSHGEEPDVFEDDEALRAIVTRRSLGLIRNQDELNALNPDHLASGRRHNPNKTWALRKLRLNHTVRSDLAL